MKNFDKPAAMRGARVCTREGLEARILCFDIKCSDTDKYKPILAEEMLPNGRYSLVFLLDDGRFDIGKSQALDLMMADDNYQEKLERGCYGKPDHIEDNLEMVGHILPYRDVTPSVELITPFDDWRRMFAGMAMQGMLAKFSPMPCCHCSNVSEYEFVASEATRYADALIDELKKQGNDTEGSTADKEDGVAKHAGSDETVSKRYEVRADCRKDADIRSLYELRNAGSGRRPGGRREDAPRG